LKIEFWDLFVIWCLHFGIFKFEIELFLYDIPYIVLNYNLLKSSNYETIQNRNQVGNHFYHCYASLDVDGKVAGLAR
jgi:hypothetical protein